MHEWREWLYPLGYLASVMFGLRFIIQWFQSEKAGKSVVYPSFWRISLCGNVLFFLHALIQVQFHIAAIQAANMVILWRNLNLMQPLEKRYSLAFTIMLMITSVLMVVIFFLSQSFLFPYDYITWFRSPFTEELLHPTWHILGAIGLLLFNSRFWVQWFDAENSKESRLGPTFWWMSVSGGLLTLIYFFKLGDPVNMIGPGFGMIPYTRNLMLIYKNRKENPSSSTANS